MGNTAGAVTNVDLRAGHTAMVERGRWLRPEPATGRGLFELALKAASIAWHPHEAVTALPLIATDPALALPVVLEAWRATERELAGMIGNHPDRDLLEANASMLRAMYQRLYRERMSK